MRELRYSPEQPRDSHGRFGTGDAGYDPNNEGLKDAIGSWQNEDDASETPEDPDSEEFISEYAQTRNEAWDAAKAGGQQAADNPIIAGIRNEEFKGTIYRGLTINEEDEIAGWKAGMTVQLLPSSFTKDESIAEEFAGRPDKAIPVMMEVRGGGAGIVIGGRGASEYKQEKEVITGGQFKVVSISIKPYDKENPFHIGSTVVLKQVGVF